MSQNPRQTYSIIHDEHQLTRFINDFLPNLKSNERFYCALFARKKYTTKKIKYPQKGGRSQLVTFVARKEYLFNEIQKLEVPLGSYSTKNIEVPEESLAFYILPNPRDTYKATLQAIKEFAEVAINQDECYSPHRRILSIIHRTPVNKKPFTIFDIDEKNVEILKKVNHVTHGYHHVLETRGGYHIIIERKNYEKIENLFGNKWYPALAELSDQSGDIMIPVPGTYQGDFKPKLLLY